MNDDSTHGCAYVLLGLLQLGVVLVILVWLAVTLTGAVR